MFKKEEENMQQEHIHQFLEHYFTVNHCDILENTPSYLVIQLTPALDKMLMNRPFYWHYLEKMGGTPNPMKITLITDSEKTPDHVKGEYIHFGSPRLHQIFQTTKKLSRFMRLYENLTNPKTLQTPLYPWICLNMRISYQCDRNKDIFRSLGYSLTNGSLIENFHDWLLSKSLTPTIPDLCYTIAPIIKPENALKRIEDFLTSSLLETDHQWAVDARKRWEKDLQLLEQFYEDAVEKPEAYESEKAALRDQYEPVIKLEIINGGIFYLGSPMKESG